MTVVTVRPDTRLSYSNMASGYAASDVNDDNDATYGRTISLGGKVRYTLADPTIPAGAKIKTLTVRLRCARDSASGANPSVEARLYSHVGAVVGSGVTTMSWTTPTTVTPVVVATSDYSASNLNSFEVDWEYVGTYTTYQVRVHEVYVDVTYAAKPVTTQSAPTGTFTTTNTPEVAWANTLDSDGGAQTAFEVKFYTAAEYGGGGFDPDTTTVTTTQSGVTSGAATTWTPSVTLADGTYRAYVRVAQTVNGAYHWSDWDYTGFDVDVLLPAVPDLVLHPDTDDACMHILVTGQAGDATTDALEIQRSTDGGVTWQPVRLPADA